MVSLTDRRIRAGRLGGIVADDHGGTLIEMAVVLPSFFMLLFGFFGFVVAFFGLMNANYAVNTAVRYASVHSSTSKDPATTATIQGILQANMWLPASMSPTLIVTHTHAGTLYYNYTGATVGDLTGAGVVWTNVPIWGITGIPVGAEGYRMVTR
jgi:Flp pilus assembly protein TadG